MNNATELKDDTTPDDVVCSKPYLIKFAENQPAAAPYVLNAMTWEDEVEKVVVLCNN